MVVVVVVVVVGRDGARERKCIEKGPRGLEYSTVQLQYGIIVLYCRSYNER
jgi:hypothetical protein